MIPDATSRLVKTSDDHPEPARSFVESGYLGCPLGIKVAPTMRLKLARRAARRIKNRSASGHFDQFRSRTEAYSSRGSRKSVAVPDPLDDAASVAPIAMRDDLAFAHVATLSQTHLMVPALLLPPEVPAIVAPVIVAPVGAPAVAFYGGARRFRRHGQPPSRTPGPQGPPGG